MAIIGRNKDGSYSSACALCGKTLSDPIFATTHFIGDQSHDLSRYSDVAMHWSCYTRWEHQARFASMYFEMYLKRSEDPVWQPCWGTLLKSADVLVMYGFVVDKVSVVLRKTGRDWQIARDDWKDWVAGGWREKCRPGLELEAVGEVIEQLAQLTLPALP
jgi:hypothetical protein